MHSYNIHGSANKPRHFFAFSFEVLFCFWSSTPCCILSKQCFLPFMSSEFFPEDENQGMHTRGKVSESFVLPGMGPLGNVWGKGKLSTWLFGGSGCQWLISTKVWTSGPWGMGRENPVISPQPSFVHGRHMSQSLAARQFDPTDKNTCLVPILLQNSTVYKARLPYKPHNGHLRPDIAFQSLVLPRLKIPQSNLNRRGKIFAVNIQCESLWKEWRLFCCIIAILRATRKAAISQSINHSGSFTN